MRKPRHVIIDGRPHSGPVAMHTCPTTGIAAPLYRDDAVPVGQFAPIACATCDYRRHGADTWAEIEALKPAIVAALSSGR